MRAVILTAALVGSAGPAARADDPPTADERKELAAEAGRATAAGVAAAGRNDLAASEAEFRRALDLMRRAAPGDPAVVAQCWHNLGLTLRKAHKYQDAAAAYREALDLRRKVFPPAGHVRLVSNLHILGSVLADAGRPAEAEAAHREGVEMAVRLFPPADFPDGHPQVAASRYDLSTVLHDRGMYSRAEAERRAALAALREPSDLRARCLAGLGADLRAQGRPAEAEPPLREAVALYRRLTPADTPLLAAAVGNLASALLDQGQATAARAAGEETLGMYRRLYPPAAHPRGHPLLGRALNNAAAVLLELEDYPAAEGLYREAVEMFRGLYPAAEYPAGHELVAAGLANLAHAARHRGRYDEAGRLLAEALAVQRRLYPDGADPRGAVLLSNTLLGLGRTAADRGDYDRADEAFREADELARRAYPPAEFPGGHPHLALTAQSRAVLALRRGRFGEAADRAREALGTFRAAAAGYAAARGEGDALTLADYHPPCRDVLLSAARSDPAERPAAYPAVWASKAGVGRVYERRALAARAAAADPGVAARLAALTDARRQRAELILAPAPADPGSRADRDAALRRLDADIGRQYAEVRPRLPAVGRLDRLDAATPDDLRKALPPGAAFVDLLVYTHYHQDPAVPGAKGQSATPGYTAFVVTRDGVGWADLGPAGPIEAAVAAWRAAITAPPYAVAPDLPGAVRRLVWEPVRKALPAGIDAVYVSPDGALCGLPWAALPGDRPGSVLLEEYAVAVVPHGRFLLDALGPPDPFRRRADGLLAVGGVPYGDPADRPGGLAGVVASARARGALPADPAKKLVWDDLPAAKLEAEGVEARAAGRKLDARLLAGPASSADRVLAELSRARYAHLATHGFFADPQFRSVLRVDPKLFETARGGLERVGAGALSPMVMSGLVFAGANRPETPGRGVLTGEALVDRDLSGLELAVLSACETGLGDVAGGEGVFGLQRAFHLAGCRNVVASLWKVNDDATAALMAEFYRRLWDPDRPLPPAEALRQAQLAVRRADPKGFRAMANRGVGKGDVKAADVPVAGAANPPAYWAGFVLSGPGR